MPSNGGIMRKFAWAMAGLMAVIREEQNMKIHLAAAGIALGLGWILGLERGEWGLLLIAIILVLMSEVINTAIERTVDLIAPQYHPLAEKAKNMAAGAVLLSAISAVILGVIVFGPHIFNIISIIIEHYYLVSG